MNDYWALSVECEPVSKIAGDVDFMPPRLGCRLVRIHNRYISLRVPQLIKMSDVYDWANDAARCYDLVVEMLCEQYLAERLPGETAEQ